MTPPQSLADVWTSSIERALAVMLAEMIAFPTVGQVVLDRFVKGDVERERLGPWRRPVGRALLALDRGSLSEPLAIVGDDTEVGRVIVTAMHDAALCDREHGPIWLAFKSPSYLPDDHELRDALVAQLNRRSAR